MPIELAYFDLRSESRVRHVHATQRDDLAQDGRADGGRDLPDLSAPDAHAIARRRNQAVFKIESDQPSGRMRLAPFERVAADEVVNLRLERHREPDSGLERIGLVGELAACEDEPGLDADHVERCEPEGGDAERLARSHDLLEQCPGILRVAEELIAELPGISGAGHDEGHAVKVVKPGNRKPEPAELTDGLPGRARPENGLEDLPALRALHRDVRKLLGRGLDPRVETPALRLLAQPQSRQVVAANPAEVVVSEPEDGPVVDHSTVLVAHRSVHDLPDRKPPHVAGHAELHELLGAGPEHLVLAKWREVHDHRPLPARPVLADRSMGGKILREPVAVVLDEVPRMRGEAVVESGVLRRLEVGIGGHSEPRGWFEILVPVIHPHLDVGRIPSVRGIDVARTRGGEAHEVGESPHEHEIPRTRPRVVHPDGVAVVEQGVVEEIDRGPSAARPDSEPFPLGVDVVRAVHMPRVSHVLVVACGACEPEEVVATASILDQFQQRLVIDGVVLRVQAGPRVERAHQGAGGGGVDLAFEPSIEGTQAERLEVRALTSLHIDNLDELPRLDLVAPSRPRPDVEIDQRLRKRRRRPDLRFRVRSRFATDIEHDLARSTLFVDRHRPARCTGHQSDGCRRDERRRFSCARFLSEQPGCHGAAEIEATSRERFANTLRGRRPALEGGEYSAGRTGSGRSDERGIGTAVAIEDDQLARLSPFAVDDGQLVPGIEGQGARAPARDRMPLHVGRQHGKSRDQHRPAHGRYRPNGCGKSHVTGVAARMRFQARHTPCVHYWRLQWNCTNWSSVETNIDPNSCNFDRFRD